MFERDLKQWLLWTVMLTNSIMGLQERKDEDEPVHVVSSIESGVAEMPCNISAPIRGDSIYLVLWYKLSEGKDSRTPIYSYDSRQMSPSSSHSEQWSKPTAFGTRAHFRVDAAPAVLVVTNVQETDAGTYACRVDFRQSPTKYHEVQLSVIVPPLKPQIYDDRGNLVSDRQGFGSFNEGDSLSLECLVSGGNPPPSVYWYIDNQMFDDTYQQSWDGITHSRNDRSVKNGLTIKSLSRKHLKSKLRCLAANNNMSDPVESSITLEMLFPPEGAKIFGPNQPLTSGQSYYFSCKVWGSNPAARVTWSLGVSQGGTLGPMRHNSDLQVLNETTVDMGNITVSWIRYRPRPEHHRQSLTCLGSNQHIIDTGHRHVQDHHILNIFFPPLVTLKLGRMVNPRDLEEGDDVYFSCVISANPMPYKLTWWHNGEVVHHNKQLGVIVSNHSLVLQKVTRRQAGSYTCAASNVEGDQSSNPVTITIMYKPVCLDDQKSIYGVTESETVHITCKVDAFPIADMFTWSFNTSSGGMDLPRETYTNQGSASLLSYTPKSQMEYGTVLCRASNLVGRQVVPCVYHVIPAGPPDPAKNCSLTNQTQDSIQVDCEAGFSSGLDQEFHMEVFTQYPNHRLLVNITARSPRLLARGLPPGTSLLLRVYASTIKGRSRSVTFEGFTMQIVDKELVIDGSTDRSGSSNDKWTLICVILLGASTTVFLLGVVIGIVTKIREDRRKARIQNPKEACHEGTLINKAFQEGFEEVMSPHTRNNAAGPDRTEEDKKNTSYFSFDGAAYPYGQMLLSNLEKQQEGKASPGATSDSSGFSEKETSLSPTMCSSSQHPYQPSQLPNAYPTLMTFNNVYRGTGRAFFLEATVNENPLYGASVETLEKAHSRLIPFQNDESSV